MVAGSAPPQEADGAPLERGFDLPALMKEHGIPGLSVALIEGYDVAWAKGYGVTERGGADPVTPRTLFMAGSISKPVTAVGALTLAERGRLSLDQDVNRMLRHWKLPENEFTARHRVTLASILDHTSGICGGDFFPGYARGSAVPTLQEVLEGIPPATNAPIRVSWPPSSRWEYSGNAYLVVQQLISEATHQSFAEAMRELVFAPLDMQDTSFEPPSSPPRAARAAGGTLANGNPVEGKWRSQPEMATGGLWTTPGDLAKLAIHLALAVRGKSDRVLSPRMAREMLSSHWSRGVINILGSMEEPDSMGYGFFVGARGRFGHIGGNVGYQATLVMFSETGNGAVIMTNSDVGLRAGTALLNHLAQVRGWHYLAPPPP